MKRRPVLSVLIGMVVWSLAVVVQGQPCWPWEIVNSPTTANLSRVVWNGTRYVAVGAGGTILTSTDGLGWEQRNSGTNVTLNGVAWGSGFVAVGDDANFVTSSDGLDWTLRVRHIWTSQDPLDVTWDGANFLTAVNWTDAWTSPDGDQWQYFDATDRFYVSGIGWSGTLAVIVGSGGGIVVSPNARDWNAVSSPTTLDLTDVEWTGVGFHAVGKNQVILGSAEGVTWGVSRPAASGWQQLQGIAAGAGKIIAVGWAGLVLGSDDDGLTWEPEPTGTSKHFYGITFGGGQFVAVGTGGLIARSTCGQPPTPTPTPTPPIIPCPVHRHLRGSQQ